MECFKYFVTPVPPVEVGSSSLCSVTAKMREKDGSLILIGSCVFGSTIRPIIFRTFPLHLYEKKLRICNL
jgi:hypothetical protein